MKEISENLINETEEFLKRSLKKKDDLRIILNSFIQKNKFEDFEKFTFDGKYLDGLFRVLKESPNLSEVKSVDHIKKDISETIEKMISKISEVADSLNENEKAALKKNYLELSQDSLKNLQTLSEDLDDIKKYLNYIKRKNAN
jgi:hypothetical protein